MAPADGGISEVTRRAIFDVIRCEKVAWNGHMGEGEFLSRIFNLREMSSTDPRCRTAAQDIWMHREHFVDWDDYWVLADSRFNLLRCPDETFLRFLCEMVHPAVRPTKKRSTGW